MATFGVEMPAGEALTLRLARMGSFFAGGRRVAVEGEAVRQIRFSAQAGLEHDPNGTFHVEQAYVQSFVPETTRSRPPVVLIHGGCLTGAMWDTTPEWGPGWLELFLRAGFPVHVVDGVERGRAGWSALPGIWPEAPVARSEEEIWSLYRLGPAGSRIPFQGQRFPVSTLGTLLMQHVPRWFSTIPAASAALMAVLERTGPAVLLSHSNGGLIALEAAWQRPDLIAGLVCIEPSGFPERPPPPLPGVPALTIMGDFLDATPLWRALSEATDRLSGILTAAGAHADLWRLPDRGVRGNSHMPMLDDNSADIAGEIINWLESTDSRV
jgi:pimeloyl-ACP methyl ester carboxylesterase